MKPISLAASTFQQRSTQATASHLHPSIPFSSNRQKHFNPGGCIQAGVAVYLNTPTIRCEVCRHSTEIIPETNGFIYMTHRDLGLVHCFLLLGGAVQSRSISIEASLAWARFSRTCACSFCTPLNVTRNSKNQARPAYDTLLVRFLPDLPFHWSNSSHCLFSSFDQLSLLVLAFKPHSPHLGLHLENDPHAFVTSVQLPKSARSSFYSLQVL